MDRFDALLRAADGDGPPPLDVSARVLGELRLRSTGGAAAGRFLAGEGPLALVTGLSFAAAAVVAVFALPAWRLEHNPLGALFEPIARMLQ